jgi:hypothetical protein
MGLLASMPSSCHLPLIIFLLALASYHLVDGGDSGGACGASRIPDIGRMTLRSHREKERPSRHPAPATHLGRLFYTIRPLRDELARPHFVFQDEEYRPRIPRCRASSELPKPEVLYAESE